MDFERTLTRRRLRIKEKVRAIIKKAAVTAPTTMPAIPPALSEVPFVDSADADAPELPLPLMVDDIGVEVIVAGT